MHEVTDALISSPEFAGFLFNNLSSAIFLVDRNIRVQKINDAFKTLFSKEESEAIGLLCGNSINCGFAIEQHAQCGTTPDCAACTLRNCINESLTDESKTHTTYLARTFYIAGEPRQKHLRITTNHASWEGEDLAIVAIDDITELEEQKQKLQELASKDPLTGLYNRRYFFETGENIFQNAKRGNLSIAVAMFDIDHFKRINDAHGHTIGDFVLKAVADILTRNLRKADLLARFGGEEFCLLLHCREQEDSYTVIDKIRLLVEQNPILVNDAPLAVTISAGLTTRLEDSLETMIRHADEMLYRAKEGGRDRTEEYAP